MTRWTLLLGGLTIWAAHFFLLYAFSSIFPDSDLANVLSLVATVPALAADAVLIWIAAGRALVVARDEFDKWVLNVAGVGGALSFVAVLWQSLPAMML